MVPANAGTGSLGLYATFMRSVTQLLGTQYFGVAVL